MQGSTGDALYKASWVIVGYVCSSVAEVVEETFCPFFPAICGVQGGLIKLCLTGLFVALSMWLALEFGKWNAARLALFKKIPEFKQWMRVYMSVAHGCDHRILDALWWHDHGIHGRAEMVYLAELIRDVCLLLKHKGWTVTYEEMGWETTHITWTIARSDGKKVVINRLGLGGLYWSEKFEVAMTNYRMIRVAEDDWMECEIHEQGKVDSNRVRNRVMKRLWQEVET
jgi:hypothetical protein